MTRGPVPQDVSASPSSESPLISGPDDVTKLQKMLGILDRKLWVSEGTAEKKLYEVPSTTKEYKEVAAQFCHTMPSETVIHMIERVESGIFREPFASVSKTILPDNCMPDLFCGSGFLHESFCVKQREVKRAMGKDWDEQSMVRLLFHGAHVPCLHLQCMSSFEHCDWTQWTSLV